MLQDPYLRPASQYHLCPAQQEAQVFLLQERNKTIDMVLAGSPTPIPHRCSSGMYPPSRFIQEYSLAVNPHLNVSNCMEECSRVSYTVGTRYVQFTLTTKNLYRQIQ